MATGGKKKKKKILAAFHTDSQGCRTFSAPLTHLCLSLLLFFFSSFPSPFALPFFTNFHQNFTKTGALWSPPMRWGQRCSRLKRTSQIEFTLDETNRFACVYPPETGWPASGNELSHLWTVQCAQLINGLLSEEMCHGSLRWGDVEQSNKGRGPC